MTTALYKLIFNTVQHHACQTIVQDTNHRKIIFCVWQRVISSFFFFFFPVLQCGCFKLWSWSSLLQTNYYVNPTDPVKVKEKQILFLCVLRNNAMDYLRVFCIWKDWDNTLKWKLWLLSWTLTQICIVIYDFRGWSGEWKSFLGLSSVLWYACGLVKGQEGGHIEERMQ